MIADLLPLLVFTTMVVIGRNLLELALQGHARRRQEATRAGLRSPFRAPRA